MTFACVLLLTVLACFIGRRFIHRHPAVLYVFAVAVDAAYLAVEFFGAPFWLWNPLFLLVQKCLLALALFVVVMGIGCFSRASSVSVWLRPVRAELSIAACLLAVGHMVAYVGTYVSRLAMGSAKDHVVLRRSHGAHGSSGDARGDVGIPGETPHEGRCVGAPAEGSLRVLRARVRAPGPDAGSRGVSRRCERAGEPGRVHGGVRCVRRGPHLSSRLRRPRASKHGKCVGRGGPISCGTLPNRMGRSACFLERKIFEENAFEK